jgi:Uncharacterised nucleotidyltransferase
VNRPMHLPRAEPKSLMVGPVVRACVPAGTSFGQALPGDADLWRHEVDQICSQRLGGVALDALRRSGVAWAYTESSEGETEFETMVRHRLTMAARRDAIVTLGVERGATEAIEALTSGGIQFLVVKGPAVARFHPQPSLRTYTDVDVLVSPKQFRDALVVLEKLEFQRIRDAEAFWMSFDEYCMEGFNLHRAPSGNIDLHHHASPWHFGRALDFDEMFERSDQGAISGVPCLFASLRDAIAFASLHLVNDLGKDDASLMTWRDLVVLRDISGPEGFHEHLVRSGLGWFEPLIRVALNDFGVPRGESDNGTDGPRGRMDRARLALMGWNQPSTFTRHPVGWTLRLSVPRALLFLAGSLVPSRSYVRARYPGYRAYWYDAFMSARAAWGGTDFRYQRIADYPGSAPSVDEGVMPQPESAGRNKGRPA